MNLMFTGGGGPGNEAIYRLWKDQYKLYFADADLLSINPSIPRAVCYEIPLASNPIFFDELLNLVKKIKINILIPGVDEELLFTKKLESVVSDMTVLSPDVSYIETMLDKFSKSLRIKEIRLVRDGFHITVSSPNGGSILINAPFMPFWKATANGNPTKIIPANMIHMLVEVPAGSIEIKLSYIRPRIKDKFSYYLNTN